MKKVIAEIVDDGDFFEVFPLWAMNIVCGFARVDGHVVGIVGNQPQVLAGCLDIDASEKAARFVRTCDAFNIPLVTFVDVPGFLPGTDQEYGGIIRHGAKLLYAYCEATVPRRADHHAQGLRRRVRRHELEVDRRRHRVRVAVGRDRGDGRRRARVNIIFRREIEIGRRSRGAREPSSMLEYEDRFLNPYQAAERGYVDDVIDPRDTRKMLARALAMLRTKREQLPAAQARQHARCDRRAEVVGGNPSPEQVAAIVAALVGHRSRARRRRARLDDAEPMSMWVEASPRAPRTCSAALAPRGRLGRRSRADLRARQIRWHTHAACGQSPVVPSMRSRRRSAWPLWRAYSSIMCTSIHRTRSGARLPGRRRRRRASRTSRAPRARARTPRASSRTPRRTSASSTSNSSSSS